MKKLVAGSTLAFLLGLLLMKIQPMLGIPVLFVYGLLLASAGFYGLSLPYIIAMTKDD